MSNEFLVDTIYNHEYLKKVLGLIKSIKKNNKFDYIEKINEQFNIKDDEEIYNKFFSELENINKNGIVSINNRRRNPNCIHKIPSNYYNNHHVECCNHHNHHCSGNHPIIPEYDKDVHSDLSNNSEEINEFDIDSFDSSYEKKPKEKRIYVDGIFDLSHSGHFNAMRQAKKLGDVVVVGINSDEDALNSKGVTPVYTQDERGALVAGCKWVDEVIIGTKYNVDMELLKKYNCDYAAHGSDIAYDRNGVCCYEDVQKNNRLKVFERSYGISTTTIVNHLLQIVTNPNKISAPQLNNLKNNSLLDVKDEEKNKNCDTNSMANSENGADNINSTEDKMKLKISKSDSTDIDNTKVVKGDKKKNSDVSSSNTKVIISKNKGYIAASQIYLFMEKHEKKKHHKVVYVDGSFDMFHLGHLKMIENARKLGDYLLVGVYSDETVRKLKGNHFPVTSVLERTLTVLAMKGVDDVVICAPWVISESFIKRFQIDTVVRGSIADYNYSNFGPDPYAVPKKLNIFKEIPSESDMTTYEIMNRIEKNKQYLLSIIAARKKKEDNIWKNNNSYTLK